MCLTVTGKELKKDEDVRYINNKWDKYIKMSEGIVFKLMNLIRIIFYYLFIFFFFDDGEPIVAILRVRTV